MHCMSHMHGRMSGYGNIRWSRRQVCNRPGKMHIMRHMRGNMPGRGDCPGCTIRIPRMGDFFKPCGCRHLRYQNIFVLPVCAADAEIYPARYAPSETEQQYQLCWSDNRASGDKILRACK